MSTFDLEYTICQIQSGRFSMAAKSHRQEGGSPRLEIRLGNNEVEWVLSDLDHGIPETVAGQERRDRIDFYFLLPQLRMALSSIPRPRTSHDPQLRLDPVNSQGFERTEGKRVRMVTPVCRFHPVDTVHLYSQTPPAFEAEAVDATLHLDFETGPKRIYGDEILEVHFGIEAEYTVSPLALAVPSSAVLSMTDSMYATIVRALTYSLR